METKTIAGIFAVIGLLLGFGGTIALSGDVIDNTYVCTNNGNVGSFDKLSSTGVTGYYKNEFGDTKGKQCRTVGWTPIKDYAVDNGVSIETLLEPQIKTVVVEKIVQSEDCPVRVLAYINDCFGTTNKFICEGIGPGQKCEKTDDILSELG